MRVTHIAPASSPAVARRPAFGRQVVDFTGTAPVVVPALRASAPLRASKREEIEAAHAAEAKALAEVAAKAKADADAAFSTAAEAKRQSEGNFGAACGHSGCGVRMLANMMYFRGEEIRCRKHQVVGFCSWGHRKVQAAEKAAAVERKAKAEAEADAEVLASILRRRR